MNTHAKVTVIENDTASFCIIGSANYTTNRRYEAGIIIADRGVSAFHKKWIQDGIDKAE